MCYGVPAAGVLCLALLKQSGPIPTPLLLPRSETVQNLSMFVAFLDWVPPDGGNYQLCQRMKTIIGRVLDQVLEGPPHSQIPPIDPPATYDFELLNDLPNWQDLGNINLWDSLEWANIPWLEENQL